MTATEFNKKYHEFLVPGHYGLDVHDPDFIEWLDLRFETFIQIPGFKYSQVKAKFGYGRFYADGLSAEQVNEVEQKISSLMPVSQNL